MPEIVKRGSGLTQKTYRVWSGRGKGQVIFNAKSSPAIKPRAQIFAYIERMKRLCGQCLREHGLPDHDGNFVEVAGKWEEITAAHRAEFLRSHHTATLYGIVVNKEVAVKLGPPTFFAEDSHPAYAAKILTAISEFERYRTERNDLVYDSAMELGELQTEWTMKILHDPDFKHGKTMKQGQGNIDRFNSRRAAIIAPRDEDIVRAWERWRQKKPKLEPTPLSKLVSADFKGAKGTSAKNIRTIVKKLGHTA